MEQDELLTVKEAAALLKVAPSWIYERTRLRTIPVRKLGGHVRIPKIVALSCCWWQRIRSSRNRRDNAQAALGAGGRRFESGHPDHYNLSQKQRFARGFFN